MRAALGIVHAVSLALALALISSTPDLSPADPVDCAGDLSDAPSPAAPPSGEEALLLPAATCARPWGDASSTGRDVASCIFRPPI